MLLAVKECYECFCIPISSELEAIWCCVKVNFKKVIIGAIYRSPSTDSSFNNALHDSLNFITVRYPGIDILLMGDFNFPNIVWSVPCPFPDPFSTESSDFITICSDFGLSQLVINPTRVTQTSLSLLDLILTSSPDIFSVITHMPGLTDHDVLQFFLTVPRSTSHKRFKQIRDYGNANFPPINDELACFLHVFLQGNLERSVEVNWNMFKNKVNELIGKHVPLRRVLSSNKAPWFNRNLSRLANKKKRLFRKAKHSGNAAHRLAYKTAATAYSGAIKVAKSTFF